MVESRMKIFDSFLENSGLEKKDYQRDAVKWCLENELGLSWKQQDELMFERKDADSLASIRGGFIADEMGLGKTIMMIGVCLTNVMRKTLIVVPVILLEQWAAQIYRTTGHRALIYHGSSKKKIDLEALEKSIIVLTTYQTVVVKNTPKNENKKKEIDLLQSVHWNRLVFDEAHHLRNANTLLFRHCYSLRGRIRWLMTGTPIQNRLKDFYHLCAFLRIPENVVKERTDFVKERLMLKRTKIGVGLSLPDLNYEVKYVPWSSSKEMDLAQTLHSSFGFTRENRGGKRDDEDDEDDYEHVSVDPYILNAFGDGKGAMFRLLSASKQTCILPKMLTPAFDQFVSNGMLNFYDREMLNGSSKLDAVAQNILEKKGNGNGKLVFCHYHLEMESLFRRLTEGGMKVLIYGKTSRKLLGEKRGRGLRGNYKKMNLNELDYDVIIIQIQTGCEGLNLQKYSEVYFISPHWNPMIEEQAVARCHRLGQTKPVFVNHFIMDGFHTSRSLDNYIFETQDLKRGIIREILG